MYKIFSLIKMENDPALQLVESLLLYLTNRPGNKAVCGSWKKVCGLTKQANERCKLYPEVDIECWRHNALTQIHAGWSSLLRGHDRNTPMEIGFYRQDDITFQENETFPHIGMTRQANIGSAPYHYRDVLTENLRTKMLEIVTVQPAFIELMLKTTFNIQEAQSHPELNEALKSVWEKVTRTTKWVGYVRLKPIPDPDTNPDPTPSGLIPPGLAVPTPPDRMVIFQRRFNGINWADPFKIDKSMSLSMIPFG